LFDQGEEKARVAYQSFILAGLSMSKRNEFPGGELKRSPGYSKLFQCDKVY
jgi:hypothetical protein